MKTQTMDGSGSTIAASVRVEGLEPRTLLAATFSFAVDVGTPIVNNNRLDDVANSVATDRAGNSYVTGQFKGTADFNPSVKGKALMTASAAGDTFVAKYSATGAFLWARQVVGAGGANQGASVVVDSTGNVIVGGEFAGSGDFRPGKRTLRLTSAGGNDGFIWRLDNAGAFVSALRLGGTGEDVVDTIALDATGNVFASGWFSGTAAFGKKAVVSHGQRDGYVAKVTPASAFAFVRGVGGAGDDVLQGVSVDPTGNPVAVGTFAGTADFDPAAATAANLTAAGLDDAVVLKLTAAGDFSFAKPFGGAGSVAQGISVRVDRLGNVVAAGPLGGTVDFDPSGATSNLTSAGNADVFVTKLGPTGAFAWARRIGGSGPDNVRGITTDKPGNVYLTGQTFGKVDFDPGAGVSFLQAGEGAYVLKLNAAGNFVYARHFAAVNDNGISGGAGVVLDPSGNVLVAGDFTGNMDFDPGTGVKTFLTGNSRKHDVFLVKLLA